MPSVGISCNGTKHAGSFNACVLECKSRTHFGKGARQVAQLGGGRMEVDVAMETVAIFGYSSAFGAAPHEVAAALVRRWRPFAAVTTSYEGY